MTQLSFEREFNFQYLEEVFHRAMAERGHVNVMIAGRTGVGKSTLINAIFQGDFATTGQGRPVTQNTKEIKKEGIPLSIFDTRGLEMEDFSTTLEQLKLLIKERSRDTDPNKHIHVAWLCIAEDSRRVEPAEEKLVEMLNDNDIPVIAVITKARADQGFRSEVEKILPSVRNVISVRAIQEELDEGYVLQPKGLKELVEITMQVVPEATKRAFAAAQKVSIELKKSRSRLIVGTAATSAAAVGASPIPFSDAVVIIPIQIGMLASITATFGLPFDVSFLNLIVGTVIGVSGGTLIGRAVAANLLKFIPGAGSLLGGVINSATAIAITTTLGEAYITVLAELFDRNKGEPPTSEEVVESFKNYYQSLPPVKL